MRLVIQRAGQEEVFDFPDAKHFLFVVALPGGKTGGYSDIPSDRDVAYNMAANALLQVASRGAGPEALVDLLNEIAADPVAFSKTLLSALQDAIDKGQFTKEH
jgi:hypothetical protein